MPASFYDPNNVEAVKQREMACDAALADMVEYMRQDGVRVAVYDATNSTRNRRLHLLDTLDLEGIGAKRMFLESICDNEEVSVGLQIILWFVLDSWFHCGHLRLSFCHRPVYVSRLASFWKKIFVPSSYPHRITAIPTLKKQFEISRNVEDNMNPSIKHLMKRMGHS